MDQDQERLQAALGERYTVERSAGEGGMATVYLATDRKHARQVAIKVLRPELGATIGSDRFLREIELAARLQHPHVVPVYDSGAADGLLYYVMPYIEGESLRDRLRRDGALPLEEARRYCREIASALAYAHQRGIVHRDIKPENILLSGGHAVVADFGIARAVEAGAGGANLTGVGMAIGTPAYMAPEQATASDDVDARADQYALACVYFEMLTGRPAFTGGSPAAVMARSITGPRPRASATRQGLPTSLDPPLLRALDPDPAKRYPDVTAFAEAATADARPGVRFGWPLLAAAATVLLAVAATAWWAGMRSAGASVVAGAESIAIVPFSATGQGVESLGEGMVDLLAANLDGVGGIRVAEPHRVLAEWRRRAGEADRALATAAAVDAQAALGGSIVGTGQQVRIVAELVGRDGTRLARAQIEGAQDSVLALVDRLSAALVREVWASSEPVPSLRAGALTTASVPALQHYLAGERHYRRGQWDSAVGAFEAAIAEDSTFALAHYRLALALGWTGGYQGQRAAAAAATAFRSADRLPERERRILSGYTLFSRRDPAAADTFRSLVQEYPGDVDAWYLLGEARMHSRGSVAWGLDSIVAPFDRVLALDSTLAPAVIHPMELALGARDSARYQRYLPVMTTAATAGYARDVERMGVFLWDSTLTDAELVELAGSVGNGFHAMRGYRWSPQVSSARFAALMDAMLGSPNAGNMGQEAPVIRGFVLLGLGQLGRAAAYGDSLAATAPQVGRLLALAPYLQGLAPRGWQPERRARFDRTPPDGPWMAALKAIIWLQQGAVPQARTLVDSMHALPEGALDDRFRAFFRAARGWARVAQGDTLGGLADLRQGLGALDDWNNVLTGPVRLARARTLAARPDSRERGITLLRDGFDNDIGLLGRVLYDLGQAEEQAGRRPLAAEAYGQFLRLWDAADPVLRPLVDSARAGLRRVAGEPAP